MRRDLGPAGCFGIVLMLAAPLFVVWAVRDIKPARERQAEAVTASAVITRVDKIPYRDGRFRLFSYSYLYHFSVEGHVYSGAFSEHRDVITHRVDEIVPISYLRSNPAENNYGGTLNDAKWHSPGGWLVLAALSFAIGMAFYKGWPD